mgnify:CR=1 FL=1
MTRYAYLGPEGTFTQQALLSWVADAEHEQVPLGSVDAALDALRVPYEVIFVDDGSRDRSAELLQAAAERDGTPVVMAGAMPGGMRFAYVCAEQAGVPFVEFAYVPPEIHAFFSHIKEEQN